MVRGPRGKQLQSYMLKGFLLTLSECPVVSGGPCDICGSSSSGSRVRVETGFAGVAKVHSQRSRLSTRVIYETIRRSTMRVSCRTLGRPKFDGPKCCYPPGHHLRSSPARWAWVPGAELGEYLQGSLPFFTPTHLFTSEAPSLPHLLAAAM